MPKSPHSLLTAAEHGAYVAPLEGLAQELTDQARMLRCAPCLDDDARRLAGKKDHQASALRLLIRRVTTPEIVRS